MTFAMPKALPLATMLLCAACAGSIQVQAPAVGCSSLIPRGTRTKVPSAVLNIPDPAGDALVQSATERALAIAEAEAEGWQVFGIEQTGQLAKSNGNTADSIEITERCEARDRAAIRSLRPWYERLLPG